MIRVLKRLFHINHDAVIHQSRVLMSEKPWKRPTFGPNMKPTPGHSWNITGTFCCYCGDWIEDSAYRKEHHWWHRPKQGSWNYENPCYKRHNSDDILPDHNQWIEEMRDWARTNKGRMLYYHSIGLIGFGDCQFHSESEARDILEPFGFMLRRNKYSEIGELYIVSMRN